MPLNHDFRKIVIFLTQNQMGKINVDTVACFNKNKSY